jgi:hypothetical protein
MPWSSRRRGAIDRAQIRDAAIHVIIASAREYNDVHNRAVASAHTLEMSLDARRRADLVVHTNVVSSGCGADTPRRTPNVPAAQSSR